MLKKVLPTAMVLVLASGVCVAQNEQSKKGFFLGGGINTIDTNSEIPEPDNYFIQAGYGFSENWSVELQYSDSYKDGSLREDYEIYIAEINNYVYVDIKADISFQTTAAFLSYRTMEPFYFKAKAGYMDVKVTFDGTTTASYVGGSFNEPRFRAESGWAAGAGVGYSFGSSAIELEYLTTDDKIEIDSIALSYNYWF